MIEKLAYFLKLVFTGNQDAELAMCFQKSVLASTIRVVNDERFTVASICHRVDSLLMAATVCSAAVAKSAFVFAGYIQTCILDIFDCAIANSTFDSACAFRAAWKLYA